MFLSNSTGSCWVRKRIKENAGVSFSDFSSRSIETLRTNDTRGNGGDLNAMPITGHRSLSYQQEDDALCQVE